MSNSFLNHKLDTDICFVKLPTCLNETIADSDKISSLLADEAFRTINEWHGDKFLPDINLIFCNDYYDDGNENEKQLFIPYRIIEGLKLGLFKIINSTYPLIITSITLFLCMYVMFDFFILY